MKSNQYHEYPHIKREIITNSPPPPSLKINTHSHFIKKSPSPPLSAAASTVARPQQPRPPVIIYTHSPKIIHTHPRDFMALVQKLTGLSRPETDPPPRGDASEEEEEEPKPDHQDRRPQPSATAGSDESDTASVITEEHCSSMNSSSVGSMQAINSSCLSDPPPSFPVFDPPNPCFSNMPLFQNDYLSQAATTVTPFYNNYAESAFFMPNNGRSSSLSSSSLDGIQEYPDF